MASFRLKGKPRFPILQGKFRFLIFAVLLLLVPAVLLEAVLYPRIFAMATAKITTAVTSRVQNSVYSVLGEGGYSYEDFIHIKESSAGTVNAMSVDSVQLNLALYAMTEHVIRQLEESGRTFTVEIPMGTLFGMEWMNAKGPAIPVKVLVEEGIHACFRSEFSTQGINQTLHTVYFSIKIHGRLLFAAGWQTVDLSQEILAAQTVLLGKVPDSFTHISRLTADVSEEEIDDIFDFGHMNG